MKPASAENSGKEGRRANIYNFICSEIERRHVSPTYEEIQAATGITSKSVIHYHVEILIRQGRLKRIYAGGARSLVPLPVQESIEL